MAETIEKGKTVEVHYTGTLENGEKFDSSYNRKQPLKFIFGQGQMIAGFEENLQGMKTGEKKKFKLSPEKAYGNHDPKKVLSVPRKDLETKGVPNPKEGMMLNAGGMMAKLVSVTDSEVKIDFNRPLAGKNLNFEVEVVKIS